MRLPVALLSLMLLQACLDPAALHSEAATTGPLSPSVIQGSGPASALLGREVECAGVVSLVFGGRNHVLVIQQPKGDGDPATSDALFVLGLAVDPRLQPGESVVVRGTVGENDGRTCLEKASLVRRDPGQLPAPLALDTARLVDEAYMESLEGMQVSAADLTVLDLYHLGRYGSAILGTEGRAFTAGNLATPAGPQAESPAALVLDDGSRAQNPDSLAWLGGQLPPRVGDRVVQATGILEPDKDGWHLQVTQPARIERHNPRTARPPKVGEGPVIASFNVLNFFSTLESRGADTAEERKRQLDKLVSALAMIDADLFALIEIENDEGRALAELAEALNARVGEPRWHTVADPPEGLGSDAIKLAYLYDPAVFTPVGPARTDRHAVHSRRPLALTLKTVQGGEVFSVITSHLKSKGCGDAEGEMADHGQGCWNPRRVQQATELARFAGELAASAGDPDVLLLGDFNAYLEEDPMKTLEQAGYTNLLRRLPPEDRYSYVYKGRSGALDHALATPALDAAVSGVGIWHINADESPLLDYNLEFKTTDLYRPDPYRSSDHDPVLVGLNFQ
jgi:predicted extracellular nuclease